MGKVLVKVLVKVLIIEDESHLRHNLQEVLESNGYKVLTAANGQVGIEIAKAELPDLILCDVIMPKLDGYGVIISLREDRRTISIPIILLTAKAENWEQRYGMELGADDYLTKPFEVNELLRAIASRLERQEKLNESYQEQIAYSQALEEKVKKTQENLDKSLKVSSSQADILAKITEDLRNPLSNINMAIQMLKQSKSEQENLRYLKILQEECTREIQILNEIEYLQKLMTPENAQILQKWKLIT